MTKTASAAKDHGITICTTKQSASRITVNLIFHYEFMVKRLKECINFNILVLYFLPVTEKKVASFVCIRKVLLWSLKWSSIYLTRHAKLYYCMDASSGSVRKRWRTDYRPSCLKIMLGIKRISILELYDRTGMKPLLHAEVCRQLKTGVLVPSRKVQSIAKSFLLNIVKQ